MSSENGIPGSYEFSLYVDCVYDSRVCRWISWLCEPYHKIKLWTGIACWKSEYYAIIMLVLYHDYYVQNHASIIGTSLHLTASSICIYISNLLYVTIKSCYKCIFITWSLGGVKAEYNKNVVHTSRRDLTGFYPSMQSITTSCNQAVSFCSYINVIGYFCEIDLKFY